MEISAGVGGQEAMLFAKDLYTMYCGYIQYRGWTMEVADFDSSDLGKIRIQKHLKKLNISVSLLNSLY